MIEARQASVIHHGKRILDRVDCRLQPGQVLGVLGPNGAGKSTLMQLLSGEMAPEEGEVRLNGRAMEAWKPAEIARRRAFLLQDDQVAMNFRVHELVAMGRSAFSRWESRQEVVRITQEALTLVGMEPFAHRVVGTLSGGERRRVHLARVLAQIWETRRDHPCVLLMDEPTNHLDPQHQFQCLRLARQWSERGAGVAVALHDLNHANQFCDEILVLHEGRRMAYGSTRDVLTPETIEHVFQVRSQRLRAATGRDWLALTDSHPIQSTDHERSTRRYA